MNKKGNEIGTQKLTHIELRIDGEDCCKACMNKWGDER